MKLVKVSVRRMVEFILQSGDIDRTVGAVSSLTAMQEGGKLHRKLQKKAGAGYSAEVPLKIEMALDDDLTLLVEGRADGVITEYRLPGLVEENEPLSYTTYTIDEIKSTKSDLKQMTEPVPVHLAQAYCYAYIYAKDNELDTIDVQLTYIHSETEKIKRFNETKRFRELENWFLDLVDKYGVWVKWHIDWQEKRNQSIEAMTFPFEYRPGQKRFVGGVYRTLENKKKLFALAPTGTGKTISTFFPSLKVMGEGQAEKIFYLTAKTITRTVAEETCKTLKETGLELKSLTLTARDKICIFDEAKCNPETCERAKGHYDRVNDCVFEMLHKENELTREVISLYAQKHCVCPFEMQLDAALWADCIICDYNYVFDPKVYLKRFFGETYFGGTKSDYIFLIDEAHNLVERSREMYSAPLYLSKFRHLAKLVKSHSSKLALKIQKCGKYIDSLLEDGLDNVVLDTLGGFSLYLSRMTSDMETFLKGRYPLEVREKVLDLYFDASWFITTYDNMDQRYMMYCQKEENRETCVKIFCMDPSKDLDQRLSRGRSAIFFSATLIPAIYYKQMLSATWQEDYDLYTQSPFHKDNRLIICAKDVSSRYTKRNQQTYEKVAHYIRTVIRARNGNYLVFFPSYAYMEAVFSVFTDQELAKAGSGLQVIMQESSMTEDARQAFLNQFQEDNKKTVIGFCVLGGIFSEGIDLKAKRLIGAVIVGTGLPGITYERELIRHYYDEKNGSGYEYAYVYPGMNKVLQAGGRVIRTEEDKGVIALLDDRFLTYTYKSLFPEEWTPMEKTSLENLEKTMNTFWEKQCLF